MKTKNYILSLAIVALFCQACTVKKPVAILQPQKIDSSAIEIKLQERKIFSFEKEGVFFSNDFPTARINQLSKVNDSTFNISIEAENRPINSSSWFAFKVWATDKKNIYINLIYPDDKHRYKPKVSTDGISWSSLNDVSVNKERDQAAFKLQLEKDTLTVAAQEIISSQQSYLWMNQVVKSYGLEKNIIGTSIGGKPIVALNSTKSNGKKIVVVLSRQHPPEVSGYMAMTTFVETLLGSSALAKEFVKNYELVVIPMINPDGVDEGNWRHSFAGVDLNRDWIDFKQPETSAVKNYLLAKVKSQNAKVYFALDFHSTYSDVLYINDDRADTNKPGLITSWIKGLHDFEGNKKTAVKPSGNGSNVSKAWLGKVLNAEALTYEVGDDTPRPYLKQKAEKVAVILMEELLKK